MLVADLDLAFAFRMAPSALQALDPDEVDAMASYLVARRKVIDEQLGRARDSAETSEGTSAEVFSANALRILLANVL